MSIQLNIMASENYHGVSSAIFEYLLNVAFKKHEISRVFRT